MKTTSICICFVMILTAATGFVSPVFAQALSQRPQAFAPSERFFPMLDGVLTDEQRNSLRSAVEAQRDKIRPLEEKLRASRQAMFDAIVGGKFDEKHVRQDAAASAQAETELTMVYAHAFSQMLPPLSAPQVRQLKNHLPGMMQAAGTAPEKHLDLPPPLPRDTNNLPVVK